MSIDEARLSRGLAWLLELGTWAASAVVLVGLCFPHAHVVAIGVALFVALPVVRVVVMLVAFVRGREWRLAAIVGLVLATILIGIAAAVAGYLA